MYKNVIKRMIDLTLSFFGRCNSIAHFHYCGRVNIC